MTHNLKSEMKQSMDSLRFSDEEKNAMVYDLLDRANQKKMKKHGGRKLAILALTACLALTMLSGFYPVVNYCPNPL